MQILKVAMLSTGIGAALVAIGTAGTFIYNNWQGVGKFFTSFFASLQSNLSGDRFAPIISGLERLGSLWKSVTGEIDTGKWEDWGSGAGTSVAQSVERIADAIDRVVKVWQTLKSMWNGAVDFLNTPLPTSGLPATTHSQGRKRFGRRGSLSIIGSMRDQATDEGSGAGIAGVLDQSSAAGAAGRNTGAAFKSNLDGQLDAAKEKVRDAVREMQNMLNFHSSPTISPRVNKPVIPWGSADGGPKIPGLIDMKQARENAYSDAVNFGIA